MKKFIAILFIISIATFALVSFQKKPCNYRGDNKAQKFQVLDSLKNRTVAGKTFDTKVTLDAIMKTGDDTKRWNSSQYVKIVGYVFEVKYGGAETCNCHSKDKADLDTHIEIVQDLKHSDGTKRMICEVNRFTKAKDPSISYEKVLAMKGKKVEIEGYMFFDEEHHQNAFLTNPKGTNLWRATAWEVHPVFSIKEVK